MKIDSANAPITFEEIVMVMIKSESMPNPSGQTASNIQIKLVRRCVILIEDRSVLN